MIGQDGGLKRRWENARNGRERKSEEGGIQGSQRGMGGKWRDLRYTVGKIDLPWRFHIKVYFVVDSERF